MDFDYHFLLSYQLMQNSVSSTRILNLRDTQVCKVIHVRSLKCALLTLYPAE